ncbi:5-beta-cholestane-3-alpha,7-alpha-diol 12-alpha-hydroxylase [Lachnellula cervina]|uniref:5-beta-cholestane-3-alpha,7-alpha-diol 12-alpha-hydroxylase n=1 Tax=Lachnellula cervina TaxID=1316786 RepID=A0A7D8UUF1_9HELO|nr:5-beta-cholestane-3-alpha,7-alpha-diol 12-alpha-hydroxylase [Lachnellula cervina]
MDTNINDTTRPVATAIDLQYHSTSMFGPTVLAILFTLSVAVIYRRGQKKSTPENREPPVLTSKIPFFGHLIGMLRWQVGYMQMLSSKCPSWPAFTLRIFSSRIYVICDPALIQAAYRNTKAFDFGTFVVESSERLFGISEAGMKIMRGETAPGYDLNGPPLNGNNGDSFLNDHHNLMIEILSPGPALRELKSEVLDRVAGSLDDLGRRGKVELYEWTRDVLTIASAEAIYGPENPFSSDPKLVNALWDFESDATLLMLQLLPTFICPKAYHGRSALRGAFAKYYANHHDLSASRLIHSHLATCKKWGFSDSDIANFEISTLFLATTNTVPVSFWQLSYILSDPSLLEEIRTEVEGIVERGKSAETGKEYAVMDITLFQSQCPLLLSTFHETLRFVGAATSVRSVVSPTILSAPSQPTYHLQSPAVIQLPSGITHASRSIWGPDVDSFNPRRFLPSTKSTLDKDTRKKQSQGYLPFGGGKHLCPGRHFAITEVLSFVAAIVVGFDVAGLKVPERAFMKLGTAVRKPLGDVEVQISERKGWENVKWKFDTVGKGDVDFGDMVGDVDAIE